jgi:hypothetical protein
VGHGLDDREFESRQGLGNFFIIVPKPKIGPTQPPIQWVTEAISLGVKRPGRKADHSPQSSAEVKNAWSYTLLAQYAYMVWWSVKAQGQLYLLPLPFTVVSAFFGFFFRSVLTMSVVEDSGTRFAAATEIIFEMKSRKQVSEG